MYLYRLEDEMETNIVYRGYRGLMENRMEITI